MAKCVLVLGNPRSGTSAVAGVLHALGVRMTLERFAPPRPANPTGFYEDIDLVWLLAGTNIIRPDDESQLSDWSAAQEEAVTALKTGIADRCRAGIDWGAKSFHLVRNLGVILETLATCSVDVKVIRTTRPVTDSIASWDRVLDAGAWISDFDTELSQALAGISVDLLEVAFGDLLTDPESIVTQIAQFVGRPVSQQAIDIIDPSLRSI